MSVDDRIRSLEARVAEMESALLQKVESLFRAASITDVHFHRLNVSVYRGDNYAKGVTLADAYRDAQNLPALYDDYYAGAERDELELERT